jgi:uncharacterized protein YndB with AHSA1/START domain
MIKTIEMNSRDFVLTRVFDAPRDRVWRAWTEPERFAQWWGPKSFTNPVCEIDLRPGGRYRVTMRSPEGVDYPIKGAYLEIVKPERLVMTMDLSEHPKEFHELFNKARGRKGPPMQLVMTVIFEQEKGKTRLTIMQRFESAADRDANVKLGAPEGWGGSLDKLSALLGKP